MSEITLDTLDARVTALENASKYTLKFAGANIDTLLTYVNSLSYTAAQTNSAVAMANTLLSARTAATMNTLFTYVANLRSKYSSYTYITNAVALVRSLNYTAANINSYLSVVSGFKHGTATLNNSGVNIVGLSTTLSLGFTPTASTRIIGSVRRPVAIANLDEKQPQNFSVNFFYNSGAITAYIFAHSKNNGTAQVLPNGTYYVDWLVLKQ